MRLLIIALNITLCAKTSGNYYTVVLSNLRWDRDLVNTLEAHNSKTISHKILMRVLLESPSLSASNCTHIEFI